MPVVSDSCLDQVFRNARTHSAWLDKPVADDTLRQIYQLAKWGPTSANASPGRFVFLRSREAKERLRPALAPGNVDKTMQAPVTVIIGYDLLFYEKLPKLFPQAPAMRELFESDTPEFHGPHINYADVLFSPRPSAGIPILVGGNSQAALRRAAALGDGWYGLWRSPDQVRASLAQINEFGIHRATFEVSVRVVTRIGSPIPDSDPETTLQGDADAILHKLQQYSQAGVDSIVIEPASTDLDEFLRQLARFADEVTPHITFATSSSSGLPMPGSTVASA